MYFIFFNFIKDFIQAFITYFRRIYKLLRCRLNLGFTIIELLVVIAIIGLIAGVIIANTGGAKKQANIAKALQWSHSIHSLLGIDAIGAWNFNEGAGNTVYDTSGFNHNGTLGDGTCAPGNGSCPKWVKSSLKGKALEFDGNNDYVDFGSSSSLNPVNEITIEAWVYRKGSGTGTRQGIVQKYNSDNYMINYNSSTGKIEFWLECDHISSDSELPLETWTHITAVTVRTTANAMKLYINGKKQNEEGSCSQSLENNAKLYVGRYGSNYFEGIIDEVRIYKQGFTPEMVWQNYLKGRLTHQDKKKVVRK